MAGHFIEATETAHHPPQGRESRGGSVARRRQYSGGIKARVLQPGDRRENSQARQASHFGAWQIMTYRCDYDPAKGAVLDVRVSEGRLPN
jgi:hypothetical protein